MILNAYAVLAGFLSCLQFLISAVCLGVAVRTMAKGRVSSAADRTQFEDRAYFATASAVVLLAVNVASWPLLFLLLQSYIPEWRGVMCVYGVMQIGQGSLGSAAWLPWLVWGLQLSKPAIVFAGGCVVVLYHLNRASHSGLLLRSVLAAIACLGALSMVDAVVELSYLWIPKRGEVLSVGCCTLAFDAEPFAGLAILSRMMQFGTKHLTVAYYVLNLALIGGIALALYAGSQERVFLPPLVLAAGVLDFYISLCFLIEVAAPKLLGLPYHHCPYDLLASAPESLLSLIAFVLAGFTAGWSCVAIWFGRTVETRAAMNSIVRNLLALAALSWTASLLTLTVELAIQ